MSHVGWWEVLGKARDAGKRMACAARWLGEMLLPLSGDGGRPGKNCERARGFNTITEAAKDLHKSRQLMQHFMYFIRKFAECDDQERAPRNPSRERRQAFASGRIGFC